MSIGDVTISAAVAWIIAAAAAVAAIAKAIDIIRNWSGKPKLNAQLAKHNELLDKDNRRLQALEEDARKRDEAQAVMFRGMLSIINHELTGNGDESLKKARDEIQHYLTQR